jgi:UDP-2,3-diacylglucosamine pyrophosphatase LpxH
MCLLEEAVDQCTNFIDTKPKVHCIIFEDNAEALQAAKVPKIKQRTLNIDIKCFFSKGTDITYFTGTKDEKADYLPIH